MLRSTRAGLARRSVPAARNLSNLTISAPRSLRAISRVSRRAQLQSAATTRSLATGALQSAARPKSAAGYSLVAAATALLASSVLVQREQAECAAEQKHPAPSAIDNEVISKSWPALEKIVQLLDRNDKLPSWTWLPWGETKSSNQAELDRVLDEAVALLQISDLNEPRQTMRVLEEQIQAAHRRIAKYRQQRITAPAERTLGLDSLPGHRTKKGFDDLVAREQSNIDRFREEQGRIKATFKSKAKDIGLDVNDDSLSALLESVSGDDLVSMGIAFKNVRTVTTQLETLTTQSGEALDVARKYYGMYVALLKTMDRMQKVFVDKVDREYVPNLRKFRRESEDIIREAKDAIERKKGDAAILSANIESNQLTTEVAASYIEYLKEQRAMIERRNAALQDNLLTAQNTFRTVTVSSGVAAFLHKGHESFAALMSLTLPPLRAFENEKLRTEFQGLTARMKAAGSAAKR